ncbi:SPOR domain-containing protein [Aestuariibius sp. 2305UL40-4]|uniref:SPOR domain-containing protein n=1 Tax=Aestuariibius violaceus TaxID=3234132 RepID=UPI00345F1555
MAVNGFEDSSPAHTSAAGTGRLVNLAGAAMSLALMAGIGVWGYKLVVRDVSGIPVVRALEGPMRAAPEDPGGVVAVHQGLAVNEVAAVGTAGGPEDRLVLAPQEIDLTDEDEPVLAGGELALVEGDDAPLIPAELFEEPPAYERAIMAAEGLARIDAPAQEGEAELVLAAAPGPQTPVREAAPEVDAVQAVLEAVVAGADIPQFEVIPASVPGVIRSERPRLRPEGSGLVAPIPAASFQATLAADEIAEGTQLVQLGAFDSPEIARSEWTRLTGSFDDYFVEKARIVQQTERNGRTFYRLRAHGFEDLSDARRFCAALTAKRAECIPVTAR